MSYYRTQNYWGPQTNKLIKDNIFEEQKVIGGWPDHWRPKDYYPSCGCQQAEYAGIVDGLKDMPGDGQLNGLNSMNIHAAGFEPFVGSLEGFGSPLLFGGIGVGVLVIIIIAVIIMYMMRKRVTSAFQII